MQQKRVTVVPSMAARPPVSLDVRPTQSRGFHTEFADALTALSYHTLGNLKERVELKADGGPVTITMFDEAFTEMGYEMRMPQEDWEFLFPSVEIPDEPVKVNIFKRFAKWVWGSKNE